MTKTDQNINHLKREAIKLTRGHRWRTILTSAIIGSLFSLVLMLLLSACVPWPPPPKQGAGLPTATPLVPTIIPSPTLEQSPTPGKVCQVVTGMEAGNLNLRTRPGTSYPVKIILTEGEILNVTGDQGTWLAVTRADNTQGFINSHYCKGE